MTEERMDATNAGKEETPCNDFDETLVFLKCFLVTFLLLLSWISHNAWHADAHAYL